MLFGIVIIIIIITINLKFNIVLCVLCINSFLFFQCIVYIHIISSSVQHLYINILVFLHISFFMYLLLYRLFYILMPLHNSATLSMPYLCSIFLYISQSYINFSIYQRPQLFMYQCFYKYFRKIKNLTRCFIIVYISIILNN